MNLWKWEKLQADLWWESKIQIPTNWVLINFLQVTKSDEDAVTNLLEQNASEDNLKNNLNVDSGESLRKVSSAGRFKIITNPETVQKSRAETAPPESGEAESNKNENGAHVHFSVGEKNAPHDDDAVGSENMDSTLVNTKSWR